MINSLIRFVRFTDWLWWLTFKKKTSQSSILKVVFWSRILIIFRWSDKKRFNLRSSKNDPLRMKYGYLQILEEKICLQTSEIGSLKLISDILQISQGKRDLWRPNSSYFLLFGWDIRSSNISQELVSG